MSRFYLLVFCCVLFCGLIAMAVEGADNKIDVCEAKVESAAVAEDIMKVREKFWELLRKPNITETEKEEIFELRKRLLDANIDPIPLNDQLYSDSIRKEGEKGTLSGEHKLANWVCLHDNKVKFIPRNRFLDFRKQSQHSETIDEKAKPGKLRCRKVTDCPVIKIALKWFFNELKQCKMIMDRHCCKSCSTCVSSKFQKQISCTCAAHCACSKKLNCICKCRSWRKLHKKLATANCQCCW